MRHNVQVNGYSYCLRPVQKRDAEFILQIRLEDVERNKYIHRVSSKISDQQQWLDEYFHRNNDYYFIVENLLSGQPEGTIGIYDIVNGKAEWGRWILKKGSLSTFECLDLLFKVAFDKLKLNEVYCLTIADNVDVVKVHDSLPQKRRGVLKNKINLNDQVFDAVEHFVDSEYYYQNLQNKLEDYSLKIFKRNFSSLLKGCEFHHIGIACNDIEQEFQAFKFLSYLREGSVFEDQAQGIKGQFITAEGLPRLELLENLEGSHALDPWLKKDIKVYHFAFTTPDIEKFMIVMLHNRAKVISPLKVSAYFKKRICFLMLQNYFVIELVEI